MDLGIAGKRALVCGGSRGLGFGCASALAREGVDVTIVARDPAKLSEAAAALGKLGGGKVQTVQADVTTAAGRDAMLAACAAPDILINNAGGPPPGDFRTWNR